MPRGNFLSTNQKHYRDLGSARHQYGISAFVTQTSFCEGSSGDLTKRRLFFQAIDMGTMYPLLPSPPQLPFRLKLIRLRRIIHLRQINSLRWEILPVVCLSLITLPYINLILPLYLCNVGLAKKSHPVDLVINL